MIDRDRGLNRSRRAKALGIGRGGVHRPPRPVSGAGLKLMRRIDGPHLDYPFAGGRMLKDLLNGEGQEVVRRRGATLMRRMGIAAIHRLPNASKPAPERKIYRCPLRNVAATRPNQVWATDITYVPMSRGFVRE